MITERRMAKLATVAAKRQHMTVILENVHDRHNIGAVMRTCDAVGIQELHVLYTEKHLQERHLEDVKSTSTGVRKWLDIYFHTEVKACMKVVNSKYDLILGTHLSTESKDLYDLDLTQRVALLFGNEHQGISEAALDYCDGNFTIPQFGMVGSLNISVACAVTLYEAARQRKEAGNYAVGEELTSVQKQLYERYIKIHTSRYTER